MRLVFRLVYSILALPRLILYPMKVRGKENIPDGACILCPNHSNFTDPILLAFACGWNAGLNFMSKQENMKVPVLGWIYKKCGAFGVDREGQDIEAFRMTRKLLKSGQKVVIFPEGTRTPVDDPDAGHPGAVRFAARQNVPIVPIHITRNKKAFRLVHITFGEPYYVEARNQEEFTAKTRELMLKIFALGEST